MAEFCRSSVVPRLEGRRSCQERSCYRPHTHDTFAIGAIDADSSVLAGPTAGPVRLGPGDVVVIPAGQVHACNPQDGRWRYQMIYMDQDWVASLAPPGCGHLVDGVRVLRRSDLPPLVTALNAAIFGDLTREQIKARLRDLLGALGRVPPTHVLRSGADPRLVARLEPVLRRLRTEATNPALSDLADEVGMTPQQLVRAVGRATGLPPLAWRQNARIVEARRLLGEGRPIAETAQQLGFTDQSHLHRVFRAHVAATPGGYQGARTSKTTR